jgi:uncharacterized protein (TIGR02996 family)
MLTRYLLAGEREQLSAVVDNLADDAPRMSYADWLEERGDERAQFLRAFVKAAEAMDPAEFPAAVGLPEEWLELIGYRLVERIAEAGAPELKDRALRLARPALRMNTTPTSDPKISIGASKIGGQPDLAPGYAWPRGQECRAIYNSDTAGVERLAGFLAQIYIGEISDTLAARVLPANGVLSFFCFQDIENDDPDVIGAKVIYFPDPSVLVRSSPREELTAGNEMIPAKRLTFEETLDLPEHFEGPWSEELGRNPTANERKVLDHFRVLNFDNVLGYARATTGCDPTPSRQSRHLIVLSNAVECRLHIQIDERDLAARNFDRITLNWVDFD